MAKLIATHEGKNTEYAIEQEAIIGRSSECTIRVPGGKASRKHIRVFCENGIYYVEDLGSSNGTFLSGNKLKGIRKLKNGQIIRIGSVEFRFAEESQDPLTGTTLGNYRLEERIGKGGMGTVYRAIQVTMERQVALKVLSPEFAKRAGFVENFLREAQIAGRLSHPNIITIIDFGEESDYHFFSMEYVKGEDLQERIDREERLAPSFVCKLAIEVASALAHAHSHDIIHQDIKPLNIMLTADDHAKVADLGLAKVMRYGVKEEEDSPAMGTPEYIPPEVMRKMPPDPRSDIYSLSATMFHMLTGRPPYEGDSPMAIVRQHLESPVPDPRSLTPQIPAALAELVMQGMSKDPARRPATCVELVARLQEISTPTPAAAPAPDPVTPPQPSRKKNSKKLKPVAATIRPKEAPSPQPDLDATTALPAFRTANPYSTTAKLGAVGGIALVVLIAAWGFLQILSSNAAGAAAEAYKDAEATFKMGNMKLATSKFLAIKKNYPDREEAKYAQKKLAEIAQKKARNESEARGLRRIKSGLATEILSTNEALSQLRELSERNPPQNIATEIKTLREKLLSTSTPQTNPAEVATGAASAEEKKDAEDKDAMEAWLITIKGINNRIRNEKFTEARDRILNFIANRDGTKAAEIARKKLAKVDATMKTILKSLYENGLKSGENGDLANAQMEWRDLLRKSSKGEWADKARAALAKMDDSANKELFAIFLKAQPALHDLRSLTVSEEMTSLSHDLAGRPQEKVAKQLATELELLGVFQRVLSRAIVGGHHSQISVLGQGLRKVAIGKGGALKIGAGEASKTIGWGKISLEDIANLAPPETLSEEERLGAGLYFILRNHLGYAKSYLESLPKGKSNPALIQQAKANSEGRILVDWIDFSDFDTEQRWSTNEGNWEVREGIYHVTCDERADNTLQDRDFPQANIAIGFSGKPEGRGGSVALLLAKNANQYIAVRRAGNRISLEFANQGRPRKKTRDLPRGKNNSLKLIIEEGKAKVLSGTKEVVSIDAPESISWRGRLQLQVIGKGGTFGSISVAIGPSQKMRATLADEAEDTDD